MTPPKKLKIALMILALQAIFAAVFFFGFLLDPLVGVVVMGAYFFVVTPYFMYRAFSNQINTQVPK